MKLIQFLLILLLLAELNVCDDSPVTTQHDFMPHPCGRIKLVKAKKCWWPICKWPSEYKLHFYDLITTNDTIPTADNIECTICKLDPYGKEKNCTSQPCNQLEFDCIKVNRENNDVPSPTPTIATDTVSLPTITNTNKLLAQSEGRDQTNIPSTLVLGAIIGLLSVLVLLLIAGWMWTCWIMKKKGISLSRIDNGTGQSQYSSNGYSTTHHVLYENSSPNKDLPCTTPTPKFESSTNYSLLTPEKEVNTGTEGGRVTNGKEEYCLLDRSSGKAKTTAHLPREQFNGYGRLFSN